MTLIEKRRSDTPTAATAGAGGQGTRRTWIVVSAVVLVAVAIAIAMSHTGLAGDARGNPAQPLTREDPLWGITNWPAVFSAIFVVVAAGLAVVFARLSLRQRSMHFGLIVFLSVTGLSLLDPPANWVTFTVYDSQYLHFPTTWKWMSLAPLVEPVIVIPGYPMYFLTIALLGGYLAKKVLARSTPGSLMARHPRSTYFGVGFLVGLVWDIPTELFMIRAHMYHYPEAWGPTIGAGHGRYPIVWGFFTWFAIATVTILLHRDDRGRSLAHNLADKLPGRAGPSSPRLVLAGTLFLMGLYLIPMGMYAVIRVTGLSHPNLPHGWPYPEAKVYDPYGHLAEHGIPGPYYK
jgi:hypothetical protein